MPSRPRKDVVRPDEVGVYHCWSRCVRRAFLCGLDSVTGKDFEHRRVWIQQFEEHLAGLFAIEIGFRTEMSNHIHLVLRNRPDVVASWSDEEVANRWLQISHLTKSKDGQLKAISAGQIAIEKACPDRVQALRLRLSDPSFFMAALCEYISRRSNREDGRSGTFWEDRFGCRELADEASIVVCGIYIDLNQIRAGEATTPETSTHTSAYDRIGARRMRQLAGESKFDAQRAPDGWLCELTIDELKKPHDPSSVRSATARRASDKGLIPMSLDDYLQLLDVSGRMVGDDQTGAIPGEIAPILERLGIQTDLWPELVTKYHDWFGHIVGSANKLLERALQTGRKWYRGQSHCAAAFG